MPLFFKEHFQPIVFQELKDWKMERCCMKDDICLLDHHQRSLWNTITNGRKEMINRVLQLNISQLENSFNSHMEKHFKLDLPSQPNSLIQLVIEGGNLWPKRLLVSCKENLVLQIERGNLWKMKTIASWKITIERGNLWKQARTKCKKLVLSNIVMTWISSTLRLMTKTSTSTSQVYQMRWWNDRIALTFTTWFSRSRITLNDKRFKVIFNNIEHLIPSAKSQKMRLWLLGTLNYAR